MIWTLLAFVLLPFAQAQDEKKPSPPAPAQEKQDSAEKKEPQAEKKAGNEKPAPQEPSEPYRAYSTADGHASYFVTEPGAPAHPAILMQQVAGDGQMKNTGCAYGDKLAYDQLMAYLTGLKAGRK